MIRCYKLKSFLLLRLLLLLLLLLTSYFFLLLYLSTHSLQVQMINIVLEHTQGHTHTHTHHSVGLLWTRLTARGRDLFLTAHNSHNRKTYIRRLDSKPQSQQARNFHTYSWETSSWYIKVGKTASFQDCLVYYSPVILPFKAIQPLDGTHTVVFH